MAEQNGGEAVLIQDSEISKNEKMSFSIMLQIHLSRISQSRSQMTTGSNYDEKILTFNEQVELLEDFMAGYHDTMYKTEVSVLENYTVDPIEHAPAVDNQLLVINKVEAVKYIRKKLQALMRLLARKNLLLREDGGVDI